MKKKFHDGLEVYRGDNFDELPVQDTFEYPFRGELLALLKKENPLKQEYFYIKKGTSYAFFVLYYNRMNLFTFGKATLFYPVKVVGFPCSFSSGGYITNDEEFLMEYLNTIKGAKLVLNVDKKAVHPKWITGETLPTCILKLHDGKHAAFENMERYINLLRSPYRRRIRKAIKACGDIKVVSNGKDSRVYDLYLNTYEKSDYKLERLEAGFFEAFQGENIIFYRGEKPVGFVLLKDVGKRLDFLFCGMDYEEKTVDLYFYMLYHIVKLGIERGYESIDLGQTSELTKMKFGAVPRKKYFYASHSNALMRLVLKMGKGLLEYHYNFPEFRVFKEETE